MRIFVTSFNNWQIQLQKLEKAVAGKNVHKLLPPWQYSLWWLFRLFRVNSSELLNTDTRIYLYADDAKIYRSILTCVEDSQCLQRVIDKVKQWCDEWLLPLNVSKCNVMSFTSKVNLDTSYCIRNKNLCGRDGRTICGPLRVTKSTYVTLAHKRKPKFFYFGCSLVRRFYCKQSTSDNGTDGQTDRQTDRVRRNKRPHPREEGRIIM